MRIAIAGFQHETNTFAPSRAGFAEFRMADSWPGLLEGDSLLAATAGMNLPIAGAIAAAGDALLVPLLWCAAEPSGPVTDDAFARIGGAIVEGLRAAADLDGIYLDLHGAMVTDSHEDGEGALLELLRAAVGPDMPIGVSLDLHANISPKMVRHATLMTVYRSYPHLDMAATGARCMRHLIAAIEGRRYFGALRQAPFLVPLQAQYTRQEPCQSLYRRIIDADREPESYTELAMGFTAADTRDCGPAVIAYAGEQRQADDRADELLAALCAARDAFDTALVPGAEAVRRALAAVDEGGGRGPVVIADVQDNPGAGGTADTTGLLHALIDAAAPDAVLGVVCDPEIAARAHASGVGARFTASLGARSGLPGEQPVDGRFEVLALSAGSIACTGEMYGGGRAELGPACLLGLDANGAGIRVVVSSVRVQCLDRALFTHFGVDLERSAIVCVKSTVHFRADFEPIARAVIKAAFPGAFSCQLTPDAYRRLRPGVECL